MSQVTVTKCDACGKTKGVDNHWLILHSNGQLGKPAWRIMLQQHMPEGLEEYYDICSTECIRIKLNELLKPKILQDLETKQGPMIEGNGISAQKEEDEKYLAEWNKYSNRETINYPREEDEKAKKHVEQVWQEATKTPGGIPIRRCNRCSTVLIVDEDFCKDCVEYYARQMKENARDIELRESAIQHAKDHGYYQEREKEGRL